MISGKGKGPAAAAAAVGGAGNGGGNGGMKTGQQSSLRRDGEAVGTASTNLVPPSISTGARFPGLAAALAVPATPNTITQLFSSHAGASSRFHDAVNTVATTSSITSVPSFSGIAASVAQVNTKPVALGGLAASNLVTGNVPPEIVYKMSKKIAQLTKVIYYLNTKNEDHQVELKSLVDAYEDEVEDIIGDAHLKLTEFKERFEREKAEKERADKEAIEKYTDDFERSKAQAMKQFEAFKIESEERERQLREEYTRNLTAVSKESEALKSDFQKKLDAFSENVKRLEAEKIAAVKRVRAEYEKQLESMRMNLQAAHISSEVEKKSVLESHAKKQNEVVSSIQEQMSELQSALDQSQWNAESKYKEYEQALEQERKKVDEFRQLVESMEKSESEKADKIRDLELEKIRSQNKYQDEMKALEEKVLEKEEQIEELVISVASLEETATAFRELEEQHRLLQRNLSTTISEWDGTKKTLKEKLDLVVELETKVTMWEKWNQELANRNLELTNASASASDTIAKLRSDMEALIARTQEEKDEMMEQHRKEVSRLRIDSNHLMSQVMEEMIKKHEKELADADEKSKAEFARLESEIERITREDLELLENTRAELHNQLESEERALQNTIDTITKDMQQLMDVKNGLERDLADTRDILATTQENLKNMTDTSLTLGAERDKLVLEQIEERKQHVLELEQKLSELQRTMDSEWTARLAKELASLRETLDNEHSDQMANMIQNIKNQHKGELEGLRRDHRRERGDLETEIGGLRTDVMRMREECMTKTKELDMARKAHTKELESIKAENASSLARLNVQNAENTKRIQQEHDEEIARILAADRVLLEEKLEEAAKDKADSLEKLEKDSKKAVEDVREACNRAQAAQLSQITHAHSAALSSLSEAHRGEKERLMHSLKEEMTRRAEQEEYERNLRSTLDTYEREMAELKNKAKSFEMIRITLQNEKEYVETCLQKKKAECEAKNQELADLKIQMEKELRDQETTFVRQHRAQMDKLASEALAESQAMLLEFNGVQNFLKSQISDYERKLREADERYRNREPREIDVITIQNMEEELRKRKKKIHALVDEIKFFKLELVNREESLNRMFNSRPMVGVMQPLEYNPKKQSSSKKGGLQSKKGLGSFGSLGAEKFSSLVQTQGQPGSQGAPGAIIGPGKNAIPSIGLGREDSAVSEPGSPASSASSSPVTTPPAATATNAAVNHNDASFGRHLSPSHHISQTTSDKVLSSSLPGTTASLTAAAAAAAAAATASAGSGMTLASGPTATATTVTHSAKLPPLYIAQSATTAGGAMHEHHIHRQGNATGGLNANMIASIPVGSAVTPLGLRAFNGNNNAAIGLEPSADGNHPSSQGRSSSLQTQNQRNQHTHADTHQHAAVGVTSSIAS